MELKSVKKKFKDKKFAAGCSRDVIAKGARAARLGAGRPDRPHNFGDAYLRGGSGRLLKRAGTFLKAKPRVKTWFAPVLKVHPASLIRGSEHFLYAAHHLRAGPRAARFLCILHPACPVLRGAAPPCLPPGASAQSLRRAGERVWAGFKRAMGCSGGAGISADMPCPSQ